MLFVTLILGVEILMPCMAIMDKYMFKIRIAFQQCSFSDPEDPFSIYLLFVYLASPKDVMMLKHGKPFYNMPHTFIK